MSESKSLRPSWDETYMEMTEILAKRSSCVKIHTAAIIVKYSERGNHKSNQIIAIGYNGTLSGEKECCDYWYEVYRDEVPDNSVEFKQWLKKDSVRGRHREWSAKHEMHAEANALRYVSADSSENCIMYTLYSPCDACAKAIRAHGIKQVRYKYQYARGREALKMLEAKGVNIVKM